MQTARRPDSEAASVRVVAVKGGEMAGTWEFKKHTITIGRSPHADVHLDSRDVSRHHCSIAVRPEGLVVVDARSTNGTWVNRQRVDEAVLGPRDLVRIGGFRFKAFVTPADAAPAEGPQVQLKAVEAEGRPSEQSSSAVTAVMSDPLPSGEIDLSDVPAERPLRDPVPLESIDLGSVPPPRIRVPGDRTPADELPQAEPARIAAPSPEPPPFPVEIREPAPTPVRPAPTPIARMDGRRSIVVNPRKTRPGAAEAPSDAPVARAPQPAGGFKKLVAYAFGAFLAFGIACGTVAAALPGLLLML